MVNEISLRECRLKYDELEGKILDISLNRVVIEDGPQWQEVFERGTLQCELSLERYQFKVQLVKQSVGEGWIRLSIASIRPSAIADLRSFLSPRKIGESICEDWQTEEIRHYHGLNESELWFDTKGGLLFTYLDKFDAKSQFIVRLEGPDSRLKVGTMNREAYMNLKDLDKDLELDPIPDKDVYERLGECRDIVTNLRPPGQSEYHVKQNLLKVVGEYMFSTKNQGVHDRPENMNLH